MHRRRFRAADGDRSNNPEQRKKPYCSHDAPLLFNRKERKGRKERLEEGNDPRQKALVVLCRSPIDPSFALFAPFAVK